MNDLVHNLGWYIALKALAGSVLVTQPWKMNNRTGPIFRLLGFILVAAAATEVLMAPKLTGNGVSPFVLAFYFLGGLGLGLVFRYWISVRS